MTSDGTNSYSWDAENRLIQVTYPGTGNNSQFTCDGLGRCVKIVETVSSSVTSTKQFVWCENERCEERDGSGALTRQFYGWGEKVSGTNYFYSKDHLGSVREMTDGSGNIQAEYSYDPYGQATLVQGSNLADFQYAGYYLHQGSGLNQTMFREYSPDLGRWLSRDPTEDNGSTNFYDYVNNCPIVLTDPSGLAPPAYEMFYLPEPGGSAGGPVLNIQRATTTTVGKYNPYPEIINTKAGQIRIPEGYIPEPSRTGGGTTYRCPGTTGNANIIRTMPPGSNPKYPTGYARQYNQKGQPIDIRTGKSGSQSETHFPLAPGHYGY
jgi:RHS repeat-associated protein